MTPEGALNDERRELITDLVESLRGLGRDRSWLPDPATLPLAGGAITSGPFGFTITYRTRTEDGKTAIEWLEQGRMTTTTLRRRAYGEGVKELGHERSTYAADGTEEEVAGRRAEMRDHNARFWELVEQRGLDAGITLATAVNRALLTEDVPKPAEEDRV